MKKYFFWIKALIPESLLFICFCVLQLFRKITWQWENLFNEGQRPILLIHGYFHYAFIWFYHGKKLQKKGFGPIYTLNLKNPFKSIQKHAVEAQKKVRKIEKENKPIEKGRVASKSVHP